MQKAPVPSFLDHLNDPRRASAGMPAFFNHPRQLPLTPPEFYEQYTYESKTQPQVLHPSYEQQYQYGSSCYMNDPYYQPSQADRRARYEDTAMRQMRTGFPSAPSDNVFGPVAAPVLPPIRVPEQHQTASHSYTRDVPAQEPKQEKSAGGVAAKLDYDMDMMVDFVAQMTSGMWAPFVNRHDLSTVDFARVIQPSAIVPDKKFRSYVQSVLTSTRLPCATLLLALHYLSDRIKRRSAREDFPHRYSSNQYSHLTVALMLASKFLDDNTFQNRSWAEVSQLPVTELNAREMDWLHDIRWQLHVNWEDPSGVQTWFAKWNEYETLRSPRSNELSMSQLKLNPIDVSMRNLRPTAPISPPSRDVVSFNERHSQYDHVRLPAPMDIQWPQIRSLSPPSAGPTSASTPEYYNSASATPCYMPPHQSFSQQGSHADYSHRNQLTGRDGQLLYTRYSPIYGPGYVCETRQKGNLTYDTHSFVGLDYTKQYAAQLQVGWCELHRRYNCNSCGGATHSMYSQAAAA